MKKLPQLLLLNCWSLFVLLALPLLGITVCLHKKLTIQLGKRIGNFLHYCWQVVWQKHKQPTCVFFCSSAGEYEQAVPLLQNLRVARAKMLIVFFSNSGYSFAALKKETAHCLLSPPDLLWLWWIFFSLCRPRAVIVVRHELWPAFLYAAKRWSKLHLVNAAFTHTRHKHLRRYLLSFFDKIFTVTAEDAHIAQQHFHLPATRINVVGDSKYDRAAQRVAAQALHDAPFLLLQQHRPRQRLIIGSAWQPEIAAVLNVYPTRRQHWQVIIAPHTPHTTMVSWITQLCQQKNFSTQRYRELSPQSVTADIIVIDSIGFLTELYALADLALVGGGMRDKVHNVLEPVFHGIPTATGKNFNNSSEAKLLVKAGWLTVIDANNIDTWWQPPPNPTAHAAQQLAFVQDLCGATAKICTALELP